MSKCKNKRSEDSGLYRSRNGMIFGVAKGLSECSGFPVWFVRIAFIFAAIFLQVVPMIVVYVVLAIIMRPEPVIEFSSEEEREFYNTYGNDRRPALDRMRGILEKLDKRVQRLENAVTDPEKDWDRRFRNT